MPMQISTLGLPVLVIAFAACAAVIGTAGVALTRRADVIADRTGLGEALVGAVLVGGSTSLAGAITSISAAWQGHPSLAISNAVGGIAVQTAFLAIADVSYRRANLEHAAASPTVLSQGALLVTLLAVPLLAYSGPQATVLAVHPASIALIVLYLGGLRLLDAARQRPMWFARTTGSTIHDQPDEQRAAHGERPIPDGRLYAGFAVLVIVLAAAGFAVTELGLALAERTGLSETAVGALLTATATSLPELVTTVAAVRRGALTLALGGLIGGNVFDTLFLAFSDVAFRDGSIYHRFGSRDVFLVSLTILMTGTLLLGLLRRERRGLGGIGFESALILAFYAGAVAFVL